MNIFEYTRAKRGEPLVCVYREDFCRTSSLRSLQIGVSISGQNRYLTPKHIPCRKLRRNKVISLVTRKHSFNMFVPCILKENGRFHKIDSFLFIVFTKTKFEIINLVNEFIFFSYIITSFVHFYSISFYYYLCIFV